jgi:hypothetical protein
MRQEPSAYYNVQGSKKWKHCEILANNKKMAQIGNHSYCHKWKQQKLKHLYKNERELISFEIFKKRKYHIGFRKKKISLGSLDSIFCVSNGKRHWEGCLDVSCVKLKVNLNLKPSLGRKMFF